MGQSYSASGLPTHLGPAAWNAILPPAPVGPALDGTVTADVVVVGGGFAGLSAARRITQLEPAARVVLLEASGIADGATGRNSGFMIDLPHDLSSSNYTGDGPKGDNVLTRLNRAAIAFAGGAVEEYGMDPAFFDPVGKVNGAGSAAGHANNVTYARHLDEMREPHEVLDAQAMHALTGSRYYRSGIYTPGTVMLQPAGYARAFARGLRDRIALYERSPVTRFTRAGADWVVETPQGRVTAGRIVLANNGHLESFGFKRGKLMHIFLFASMTEELNSEALKTLGGAPRWGITPSDPMGTTMRRIDTGQGGNRIVTRTCADFRPEMQTTCGQMERARAVMRQKFDARFPALPGLRMEHVWAGHLCLSKNNVSVVQEIDTGLFSACCQNGLGAARGTLTGIAAAEMVFGQRSDISDYFREEAEPEGLPPPPLSFIGANLYLRWKEWRARDE